MPAEAWVALILGIVGIIGAVLAVAYYLGGKLSRQDVEMSGIKIAVEKIEVIISSIAVDRERMTAMERRVTKLEQWYDELRRGIGKIA